MPPALQPVINTDLPDMVVVLDRKEVWMGEEGLQLLSRHD
jgi:hypothetical protein